MTEIDALIERADELQRMAWWGMQVGAFLIGAGVGYRFQELMKWMNTGSPSRWQGKG